MSDKLMIDGQVFNRVPIGAKGDMLEGLGKSFLCGDCGKKNGYYHMFGCDMERCPKCGGQLIGCDCEDVYLMQPRYGKIVRKTALKKKG